MKRVAIVADHSLVVEAIRLALRQTAGFDVIGYLNGRKPTRHAIAQAAPDVVLVDDMNDPATAVARIADVHEECPSARVVLLTLRMDAEWLSGAVEAGARAIVCKALHPVSFGTLVREVANDNVFHSFRGQMASAPLHERLAGLTARELEILRLAAGGASNGDIARALWVTEQTVKFHLSNVYRKLGVANRTEAAHYAHVNDLLELPLEQLAC